MTGRAASPEAPRVITIDGPAGSGKSTTAREVARRLGLRHLDSGALYRALTFALLGREIPEERWETLDPATLAELDIRLVPGDGGFQVLVDGEDPGARLRSREVTRLVPRVARIPAVRQRLTELQRSVLGSGGLVADGRDMGTIIFPDAPLKFFLTASLEERARRRLFQEGRSVDQGSIRREAKGIGARDESDAGRTVAPLRRPPDALVLDTTELSFEAQVDRIVEAALALPFFRARA